MSRKSLQLEADHLTGRPKFRQHPTALFRTPVQRAVVCSFHLRHDHLVTKWYQLAQNSCTHLKVSQNSDLKSGKKTQGGPQPHYSRSLGVSQPSYSTWASGVARLPFWFLLASPSTGIRMHYTFEHCNLYIVVPLYFAGQSHVLNGCNMSLFRSPVQNHPKTGDPLRPFSRLPKVNRGIGASGDSGHGPLLMGPLAKSRGNGQRGCESFSAVGHEKIGTQNGNPGKWKH